jgi:WD40 repeat protein
MARVFISHSSRDNEPAARIKTWLAEQGFETPFLDYDKHGGIPPGADWEKTLYREIERSEAVIIIQTPNWLDSKWCFAEFTQARALGKSIFPIIETPTGDTLISPDIQALDLLSDREGGLEQLSSQLTEIALDAQGGFGWDASRPPYPGLLAFQEEDAALYFGRDDDIRRLIERLDARRAQGGTKLIALLGASGSGKSSLLRAGVIPRLKRAGRNWVVLPPMRPQVRPVDELARSLSVACGGDMDWRKLREDLNGDNLALTLSDIANDLRIKAGANEAQILLPIDQGEELFGAADPEQAQRFFEILNVALANDLPFIAVIAMRSDYLGLLQSAEGLTARFEEFSLGPMPLARIPQIIEGPARVAGLGIDEAFVHHAARDAQTEDALPLLAFALRELYDRAADDNYLSLNDYNALGDAKEGLTPLENAVRKAADDVLTEARPGEEELTALREAFVPAMVRVNDQGEYVRRPARWDDLPNKAQALLEKLAKARLLIVSQDGDDRMVEVAHEALLRKWPRLRAWLDDAREFLIGRQQLEVDLRDWHGASELNNTDALLSGLKMTRALFWLTERPHQLSSNQRKFIQQSAAHAQKMERSRARMRATVTYGSLAAFVVALGLAGLAYWQRDLAVKNEALATSERDTAFHLQSLFLADSAERLVSKGDAVTGALLALEGLKDPKAKDERQRVRPYVPEAYVQLESSWRSRREQVVLAGHKDLVLRAAFSPDGARIVTASDDKTAKVWDAETGKLIHTLTGHKERVWSVTFSPNGKRILTASRDNTARLWDAEKGDEIAILAGHTDEVRSAGFSPDGTRIVTASYDMTARVWHAKSLAPLKKLIHTSKLTSATFSPDNTRIVTGSKDSKARVWDLATGKVGATLIGHTQFVYDATFSPDGLRIVTASRDRTARVWSATTGAELGKLEGHDHYVWSAAFNSMGNRILTASQDNTARIWDATTGKQILSFASHDGAVNSAAFSPDESRIVTASDDKTGRVWYVESGEVIATLSGHDKGVYFAAFSPDGSRVVTASADRKAHIWDAATGEVVTTLAGHNNSVNGAAFSPDGAYVATTSSDMTARIWDVTTGTTIHTLNGHADWVLETAFSPDGTQLVTASKDNTARLWDVATGEVIKKFVGHQHLVTGAGFSPDGAHIVTASNDKTVRIWDVAAGEPSHMLTLEHPDWVFDAAFSPDGARIVTASNDGLARVWDVVTGNVIQILAGHNDTVWSAAFSPDGTRIVTASQDRTARIWNAASGESIKVLQGHAGTVWSAAFSPDGRRVITGSQDGTARIWDALTAERQVIIDETKNRIHRCLTPTQRKQFFLVPEPPHWCVELAKWPYQTNAWTLWQAKRRKGEKADMPASVDPSR